MFERKPVPDEKISDSRLAHRKICEVYVDKCPPAGGFESITMKMSFRAGTK